MLAFVGRRSSRSPLRCTMNMSSRTCTVVPDDATDAAAGLSGSTSRCDGRLPSWSLCRCCCWQLEVRGWRLQQSVPIRHAPGSDMAWDPARPRVVHPSAPWTRAEAGNAVMPPASAIVQSSGEVGWVFTSIVIPTSKQADVMKKVVCVGRMRRLPPRRCCSVAAGRVSLSLPTRPRGRAHTRGRLRRLVALWRSQARRPLESFLARSVPPARVFRREDERALAAGGAQ